MGLWELIEVGITPNDLRELVTDGLVEHGVNHTKPRGNPRAIRRVTHLRFSPDSSFIVTDAGVAIAQKHGLGTRWRHDTGESTLKIADQPPKPHWDRNRRALFLGDKLIKQFKEPAPNQETILAAFQEEGWPDRIDDPLPPIEGVDSKKRLHDAVVRLNRHHVHRGLRFRGDGTGQGVRREIFGSGKWLSGKR
jgi:hypothetical protein